MKESARRCARQDLVGGGRARELKLLGLLPFEVEVRAAEVAVRSRGLVHGVAQLEVVHDAARAQVEVLIDDLEDLRVRDGTGAIRGDVDGKGGGNSDGV